VTHIGQNAQCVDKVLNAVDGLGHIGSVLLFS